MILFHRLKTNVWWLKKAGFWCVSFELEEQRFFFYLTLMYSQKKTVFHLVHAHKILAFFILIRFNYCSLAHLMRHQ